jgi:hypothetical protein
VSQAPWAAEVRVALSRCGHGLASGADSDGRAKGATLARRSKLPQRRTPSPGPPPCPSRRVASATDPSGWAQPVAPEHVPNVAGRDLVSKFSQLPGNALLTPGIVFFSRASNSLSGAIAVERGERGKSLARASTKIQCSISQHLLFDHWFSFRHHDHRLASHGGKRQNLTRNICDWFPVVIEGYLGARPRVLDAA